MGERADLEVVTRQRGELARQVLARVEVDLRDEVRAHAAEIGHPEDVVREELANRRRRPGPAGDEGRLVDHAVITVQVGGMVGEDDVRSHLPDHPLQEGVHGGERHRVETHVGEVAEVELPSSQLVQRAARGSLLRVDQLGPVRVLRGAPLGDDRDVELCAARPQEGHGGSRTEDLVVGVGGDGENGSHRGTSGDVERRTRAGTPNATTSSGT
jgi:hypothetical protein